MISPSRFGRWVLFNGNYSESVFYLSERLVKECISDRLVHKYCNTHSSICMIHENHVFVCIHIL